MRAMIALVLLSLILGSGFLWAETITLKNGQIITGEVIESKRDYIKLRTVEGIDVTYYSDEIAEGWIFGSTAAINSSNEIKDSVKSESIPTVKESIEVVVEENKVLESTGKELSQVIEVSPNTAVMTNGLNLRENPKAPVLDVGKFIMFAFFWGIISYIILSLPVYMIAKRLGVNHPWMAWVPILNMYINCKMADKPGWWLLLLFIPLVNIIIYVVLWMIIADRCDKPRWVGLLFIVPIINIGMMYYLALKK